MHVQQSPTLDWRYLAVAAAGGLLAFLTGHEPFVGSLQASEVRVTELDGTVQSFAVRSGFVSVTGDSVTVLSDEATPSGQLDLEQARADLAAAEAALAADEANADKPLAWFLDEAHRRVKVLHGAADTPAPAPAVELKRPKPAQASAPAKPALAPVKVAGGDEGDWESF